MTALSPMPTPQNAPQRPSMHTARVTSSMTQLPLGISLAPMEGLTSAPFRKLVAERGGLSFTCTEFVRISAKRPLHRRLVQQAIRREDALPLCVQVMGSDAEAMREGAWALVDAGADWIDVNLGCPMPRIVRAGVGAALLRDEKVLRETLCALRAVVPGTLSVKMRLGLEDAEALEARVATLVDCGIDLLTLHPRTASQRYTGVADWRYVQAVAASVRIPVIGNGDLWYAEASLNLAQQCGCAGLMLGRPLLRNPWCALQITQLARGEAVMTPTGEDVARFIDDYAEMLLAQDCGIVGPLKELARYLALAHQEGETLKRDWLREPDGGTLRRRLCEAFAQAEAAELDLGIGGKRMWSKQARLEPAA